MRQDSVTIIIWFIYTLLKSSFVNIEPKQLNYRDFKNFSLESFKEDLSGVLTACTNSYETFEDAFKTSLDKYAPKKKNGLGDIINRMLIKCCVRPSWRDQSLKMRQTRPYYLLTLTIIKNSETMLWI